MDHRSLWQSAMDEAVEAAHFRARLKKVAFFGAVALAAFGVFVAMR